MIKHGISFTLGSLFMLSAAIIFLNLGLFASGTDLIEDGQHTPTLNFVNIAHAQSDEHMESETYPSPAQQLRDGVNIHDIQCNDSRELYIRQSQIPVCLYDETFNAMQGRGIELVPATPSTGIFTSEETQWLADNPVIRVSFDSGWTPIEYADESGNLQGITLDYIAEFEAISGADITPIPAPGTWANALLAIEERNADIMYMVASSPERMEYMSFTSPHYTVKTSMVSLSNTPLNIDDEGLVLVTINGYEIESWLDANYPDTEYVSVDNFAEAFDLLAAGGADAFASTWQVAVHHAKMSGVGNVYNAGTTGHQYDLTVGYRNDMPILGSIMQKTLDQIPQEKIDSWYDVSTSTDDIYTSEEVQWLADNPVIRVSFDSGWTPIEYADESGNLQGITLDYIAEFEAISGADITPIPAPGTWANALLAIEERNADIMYMVASSPERMEYMSFTSPHYTVKTTLVSLNDTPLSMDDGLVLVTINGYEIESWLDENYPDTEYVSVNNFAEAFDLLAAGGADAFASTWPVAVHHAKMSEVGNVYNAGTTGHQYDLTVGYRNDMPILGSIMQKTLDHIPQERIDYWYDAVAQTTDDTAELESIVMGVVDDTIALYDSDPSSAFEMITSMELTSPHYPFVLDPITATVVAHGSFPDRVGETSVALTESTTTLEEILSGLQNDGDSIWAEYLFTNPSTGTEQLKRSLYVLHDGYIIGSGYYVTSADVMFTSEETQWLADNPVIRVSFDSGWTPIEYADESGNLQGITLDYIAEFEAISGADITPIPAPGTWANALLAIEERNADIMYMVASSPERMEYMSFTSPHYTVKTSMVSLSNTPLNIDDEGLVLVTINGYEIESWLDANYPDTEYVSVDNFAEAFDLLAAGGADAFASTWQVAVHHAKMSGVGNVYNAGTTGHQYDLTVGYRNDMPILGSIMQKTLDQIPQEKIDSWYDVSTSTDDIYTSEEVQWLADNPVIRVSFDSGWTPIEYADESGNLQGITLDYIAEFEAISGADITPIPAPGTWANALLAIEERNADIMYMVASSPERMEYMSFTSPHYTVKTTLVSLNDTPLSMDDGLVLVTINGYEIESWLDENYPDTEYVSVNNFAEAFDLLAAGGADAFASTWPVAVHHAKMSEVGNVYNAGTTGHQYDLTVGYRNDMPILGSIMQKTLDHIPQERIDYWYDAVAQTTDDTAELESIVMGVVDDTIALYDSDPSSAFEMITSMELTSPHYPFVLDPITATVVAHGSFPDRVGETSVALTESTTTLEEILSGLQNDGDSIWAEYLFTNPSTGTEQLKRSLYVLHDGYIIGSGYYTLS